MVQVLQLILFFYAFGLLYFLIFQHDSMPDPPWVLIGSGTMWFDLAGPARQLPRAHEGIA